jgi:glutamine synthetase
MKAADRHVVDLREKVQAADGRFVDLPVLWQDFTVSTKEFRADAFEDWLGFDGSSICGL